MGKYYKHKKTKSGYLICAVPSCQTKKSTTTLKTFEFPSDLKRRSQWISAIVDATLTNEEETSSLEDLYSLENKRMELEMEISNILGDHSYVCARHFRPDDITVHPHVCRLTSNAVPSVFKNYPTELPRQFFKKICQTASMMSDEPTEDSEGKLVQTEDSLNMDCEIVVSYDAGSTFEESGKKELISLLSSSGEEGHLNDDQETKEISDHSAEEECEVDMDAESPLETKFSSFPGSNMPKAKMRKRLRVLEVRYRSMKRRLRELEEKHSLYNISSLEKDAADNSEEAIFLLDMLRSYTMLERTRNEILTAEIDE